MMALMSLLGLVPAPIARAIAVALAVAAVVAWLRMDATRDARRAVAVDAAQIEQETRHDAEAAARAAERDGAADRLRAGRF